RERQRAPGSGGVGSLGERRGCRNPDGGCGSRSGALVHGGAPTVAVDDRGGDQFACHDLQGSAASIAGALCSGHKTATVTDATVAGMNQRSALAPVQTVDKNGKRTTVYRK